jgi:hypothetical protein
MQAVWTQFVLLESAFLPQKRACWFSDSILKAYESNLLAYKEIGSVRNSVKDPDVFLSIKLKNGRRHGCFDGLTKPTHFDHQVASSGH